MHLKSLTLKGFKSFASSTTLRFEPGITCVVGPNGSGKSNVVDAISWVLGEQGAKALRGGKMEDVIFAGTSGRSPLGRAEVTLTIDNADGALPIEYAEVSITRRVFRSGAGEYEINGSSCRLLDVQELLSDSGIGRELHVLVGQGQLDAILQSRPEERRAFIEEAAGVLKHRKRKEKALRKLEAMEANLARLADLTTELRRQLKPLGRQAEIARRAQTIQADLRDARLRLAADDLVTLRATIARDRADEDEARRRRDETERALAVESGAATELEAALERDAPAHDHAVAAHHRLSSLAERLRGTVALAAERHRHLVAPEEAPSGPDPDELERRAEEAAETEAGLAEEVAAAREALEEAAAHREGAEETLTGAERRLAAARRAAADRREGLARLAGQVETQRGRVAAALEELETLATSITEAGERAAAAREELAEAEEAAGTTAEAAPESHDGGEGGEGGAPGDTDPEAAFDAATERHEQVRAEVDRAGAAHRDAERDRAHWKARVEALELTLTRRDGAGELLAGGREGVLGSVAALLRVPAGEEAAITAALGPAADAVVVTGPEAAADALAHLHAADAGRAGLVVTGTTSPEPPRGAAPAGARWAAELVSASGPLADAVAGLLAGVVVVEDLAAARRVVAAHPELAAATRGGDVLGGSWAVGGPSGSQSILQMQSAADEAGDRLAEAERAVAVADGALEEARAAEAAARAEVGVARQVRDDHRRAAVERRKAAEARRARDDARRAEEARRLGRLAETVRGAEAELARLTERRAAVETSRDERRAELDDLGERLAMATDQADADGDDAGKEDTAARDASASAVTAARATEVESRLALRTAEERARAVTGRAEALRHRARAEREQRDRAAQRRREREWAAALLAEVLEHGRAGAERIAVSVTRAAGERDRLAAARQARASELEGARERLRGLQQTLERLTDAVHRDEVLRAEQRTRLAQLEESIGERFGIGLEDLVREYGPDAGIPPSEAEVAEVTAARERGEQVSMPPPLAYDRAEQQRRAARAEKELGTLGKVNPLALEEYAALEERYRFLSTQLEDVKASKRDLLSVVADVDQRILDVFAEAFADVAREFEAVFPVLFPGGDGRLVLTDPDDLLTTGVEVEARPPGKKVKRLSLLSGGEKSLTAVAMLVAIFRARPSPFYVLDEVEAALDDANLRRLIGLLDELRRSSQLVIITHQKPTMEIADALYGVSMRGDGITAVVSQRLRGHDAPGPLQEADPTPVV
ncbi:chromosome segregation protein SMC [Actinomycetospora sp. TBRC 11914]|uniref:chromosome segregation protein SMC n=1 Tax=Actinomycetospora sp. TBRC 11914 TaxID=2729387 RepID=UPI00145F7C8A|nr:chromosome segregation protein SMC [Actinomycetospora sp. TBRC 11914]NMO90036.1 chromosome segregation protein SMC [Actinomycetospora sp. TBRC 11914]